MLAKYLSETPILIKLSLDVHKQLIMLAANTTLPPLTDFSKHKNGFNWVHSADTELTLEVVVPGGHPQHNLKDGGGDTHKHTQENWKSIQFSLFL